MTSNPSPPIEYRDPVCGMRVDPQRNPPTATHDGRTYAFCSTGCREKFVQDPAAYIVPAAASSSCCSSSDSRSASAAEVRPPTSRPFRVSAHALGAGLTVLALVVLLFITFRPDRPNTPGASTAPPSVGKAAGTDAAVDDGAGGVIVTANFVRTRSSAGQAVFDVSLNTHTVDLSEFAPATQVRLHVGSDAGTVPAEVRMVGDRSSHHQNYELTFVRTPTSPVNLVIHDVAGVTERRLPFIL